MAAAGANVAKNLNPSPDPMSGMTFYPFRAMQRNSAPKRPRWLQHIIRIWLWYTANAPEANHIQFPIPSMLDPVGIRLCSWLSFRLGHLCPIAELGLVGRLYVRPPHPICGVADHFFQFRPHWG